MDLAKSALAFYLIFIAASVSGQTRNSVPVLVGGHEVNDSAPVARQSIISCVPIFSFDTPDINETGVAGDGAFLWVGGGAGTGFHKCNASGAIVQTLPMPAPVLNSFYIGDLDYDGTSLWYTYEQSGLLFQIDPANGNVINQFTLPNNNTINPVDPNIWGIACDDSCLWETEYAIPNTPYSHASMLYKLSYSAVPIDSFLIPHFILPVKIIDGELWGIAFDVPYIYKIDRTSGALIDSVARCAGPGYGFTKNNSGFWVVGDIAGIADKIHLFETFTGDENADLTEVNSLSLYPQPASDNLFIQFKTELNKARIEVFSIYGTLVQDVELNTDDGIFDLPTVRLSTGVYTIRIIAGSKVATDSFVKL